MAGPTPGTVLRNLQQTQAGMRKARKAMAAIRGDGASPEAKKKVLQIGWDSLSQAHKVLAEVPLAAADEAVMTRQLAVQRYATALLVRLRRIARNEPGGLDLDDDEGDDGEE